MRYDMGMPGMTNEAVAAYAAADVKEESNKQAVSKMTVAEFRNEINHVTGYYDQWNAHDFFLDKSISHETKLEVLFGKTIANVITTFGVGEVISLIQKITNKVK